MGHARLWPRKNARAARLPVARAVGRMTPARRGLLVVCALVCTPLPRGCSHDRPPPPAPPGSASAGPDRIPRVAVVDTPKQFETATPYHARLTRGAELYIPPWFTPKKD